jgi:hypothetical protein
LWNDHPLLLIIRWWNAFEHLEAFHGSGAACSFVGDHATNSLVEDARRSTEMEWTWGRISFQFGEVEGTGVELTSSSRVEAGDFAEIGMILHYTYR